MAMNKNGFTLLELLIAAALIGVLAMFATQAFRASASDIRIEDVKARALLLQMAAERYYLEYPGATSFRTGSNNALTPFLSPGNTCYTNTATPQNLVDCGFLEYRQVAYDSSKKKNNTREFSGSVDMWFSSASKDNVTVCFKGKGRVIDHSTYCTSGGAFTKS